MTKEDKVLDGASGSTGRSPEPGREDPLGSTGELISPEVPPGVDRRDFLMRSAVVGAAAVMTGRTVLAHERTDESRRHDSPAAPRNRHRRFPPI